MQQREYDEQSVFRRTVGSVGNVTTVTNLNNMGPVGDSGDTVTVTLEFPDGRTQTLEVGPEETVIEAAERVGEGIPFGCLTGACGTCTARLLESAADDSSVAETFEYRRPPRALKERHEREGYVLCCVAEPITACRLAVGASVQAELVENPWK